MRNYNSLGTQNLNDKEIKEINGGIGFLLAVAAGLTAMGIHDSIDHPEAFFDGLLKRR